MDHQCMKEIKKFTGCSSTLTKVLVGVDIRTLTGNRNQYPRIKISEIGRMDYKRKSYIELRLYLHNFTTAGLYHYIVPTPLNIANNDKGYRLGIYQPPNNASVVRVNRTGQIGSANNDININNVKK